MVSRNLRTNNCQTVSRNSGENILLTFLRSSKLIWPSIFTTPWQKIIAATESTAQSHQKFSMYVEKDVEQPLRNFVTKEREMQAMSTIQGNLSAMAKELEEAQQRSEKLNKKSGKTNSLKIESAAQKLEAAGLQWDSQAPFVFEKLQACDETRLNHLRDVLTRYQTYETDQVESSRANAEAILNLLLEVDTAQEIQNFVKNTTQGRPKLERGGRRAPSSIGSNSLPIPSPSVEDDISEHSGKNDGLTGQYPNLIIFSNVPSLVFLPPPFLNHIVKGYDNLFYRCIVADYI
jgi:F-BAR domain only protein